MLEVTGVIEYIDSNEKPGKIVVALTGTEDWTVDCRFSKSEKKTTKSRNSIIRCKP